MLGSSIGSKFNSLGMIITSDNSNINKYNVYNIRLAFPYLLYNVVIPQTYHIEF